MGWQNDPFVDPSQSQQAPQQQPLTWGQDDPFVDQFQQAPQQQPLTWGQVGQQAIENIPESGGKFLSDIGTAVMNPLDTLGTVGELIEGAYHKFTPGVQKSEAVADVVGKFYSERYGSMEGFQQALAKDPVGILGDFATVLTGGGAAVAKAPGMAGKVGKLAAATGKAIDPLSLSSKLVAPVAKGVGFGAAELIGGLGTGTGAESLRQAAQSGFKGGETAEAFQAGMRGSADMENVVVQAKTALRQMGRDRAIDYQSGMSDILRDQTILDFSKINDVITETKKIGTYEGKTKNPSAVKVVDEMATAVDDWGLGDPAKFHTVAGFDALKQRIGDIREGTEFGSPSRTVANRVYNKIKESINNQAPAYAKVTKDYEKASHSMKEIERTFSLGEKAMTDTALRKMQSITRDNVSTNYGNRLALAQKLQEAGADTFLPALSGQTLSSVTPRGIGKLAATGTIGSGMTLDPSFLALLPFQSPRLMGEAAYYGGKGGRLASKLSEKMPGTAARMSAMQSGRLQRLLEGDPPGRLQQKLRGY